MGWKNFKSWHKGLIIGVIPLILTIIAHLVFFISPPSGMILMILPSLFLLFYIFSFIFLILAVLIGWVIHKNWKIKILVFLGIILFFSLITIYCYSGSPPSEEVKIYKGIWSPAFPMTAKMLLLDIGQLKEDGVNTLSFGPNYMTDNEGNIGKFPKWLTILFIQAAHRNGFRVFLVPVLWGPGFSPENVNKDLFFEQATEIVLEWAEIAEKYGVEMYAPSNEPAIIIDDKEAVNKWAHDVAIKIREKYSGILVYKSSIAEWGFDNDYRGYDYVGLDIFPTTDQTLEEFKSELQNQIKNGLKFAERDGAKGVILSEIGVQVKIMIGPEDITTTAQKPFSLDYQKQAYEIFFEEGHKNNVEGYVFCCWEPEFGPNDVPAEQVMKEWFNKMD